LTNLGIAGVRVGHWTDDVARTGCTVVRFDARVVASGEVRGGAPATHEFELLDPRRMVDRLDAVVITGGSAFGLATCVGVTEQLAAEGVGFRTPHAVVPIVVGMGLYDLGVGDPDVRPTSESGVFALNAAADRFEVGPVGAGTGSTVGKWRGTARSGGIGAASVTDGDLTVSALIAVNAVGDLIVEEEAAETARDILDGTFDWSTVAGPFGQNTTIGIIVTNATCTKSEARLLAEAGHDGLARAIIPAHTPADGDALVAAATNSVGSVPMAKLGLMASAATEGAIASLRSSVP
jgi:L-aminopeptidase/D-esterase-like protein